MPRNRNGSAVRGPRLPTVLHVESRLAETLAPVVGREGPQAAVSTETTAQASRPTAGSVERWPTPRVRVGLSLAAIVALAAVGGVLLSSSGPGNAQPSSATTEAPAALPPPALVSVAAVERMALAPQSWVSASVHSRSDARMAADVGGRVLALAEIGSRLRRGEALARLDTAALELSMHEQQARVARLEVDAEQAERQLARLRQLGTAGHVSGLQLDEAGARLQSLQAQRRESEAALAQVRLQIERAVPRASFDGIVVERFTTAGESVAAGAPLLRLVDTDNLEVRARAPVALASRLAAGVEVALRVGGAEHAVRLGTVVPVGDEVSRQLELRLALTGLGLPVGSAVELGLPTETAREVLVVPRDAVLLRREGNHVLRVAAGNQAERVDVELGERQGEHIEVRGSLSPGDRVIVRGGERLREGQTIAIFGEQAGDLAAR